MRHSHGLPVGQSPLQQAARLRCGAAVRAENRPGRGGTCRSPETANATLGDADQRRISPFMTLGGPMLWASLMPAGGCAGDALWLFAIRAQVLSRGFDGDLGGIFAWRIARQGASTPFPGGCFSRTGMHQITSAHAGESAPAARYSGPEDARCPARQPIRTSSNRSVLRSSTTNLTRTYDALKSGIVEGPGRSPGGMWSSSSNFYEVQKYASHHRSLMVGLQHAWRA